MSDISTGTTGSGDGGCALLIIAITFLWAACEITPALVAWIERQP